MTTSSVVATTRGSSCCTFNVYVYVTCRIEHSDQHAHTLSDAANSGVLLVCAVGDSMQ
jgi:hypothetical protein